MILSVRLILAPGNRKVELKITIMFSKKANNNNKSNKQTPHTKSELQDVTGENIFFPFGKWGQSSVKL